MDYKSVFTNLCLELQQNRSWIKGLGKNPQKSELIHWRQCLLSGGTEACSLGLRETLACTCIHVIQRLSQPRVACWHGFRHDSQKTECVVQIVGVKYYRMADKVIILVLHSLWQKMVYKSTDQVISDGHTVPVSSTARNLQGVCFDEHLNMKTHVRNQHFYST